MNWAIICFGFALALLLPGQKGKFKAGKLFVSGSIGFLVIVIGVIYA